MQNNKANAHLKIGHFKKHCLQWGFHRIEALGILLHTLEKRLEHTGVKQ